MDKSFQLKDVLFTDVEFRKNYSGFSSFVDKALFLKKKKKRLKSCMQTVVRDPTLDYVISYVCLTLILINLDGKPIKRNDPSINEPLIDGTGH